MKEILKKYKKKLFSDSHAAIVAIVLTSFLLGTGTVYIYFQRLWNGIRETIQSPTPLWASIASVLLLLTYIYLKTESNRSSQNPSKLKPNYIIKYFPIGKYIWEAKIYKDNYFEVDEYPFCATHDLRFIFGHNEKYCHGLEDKSCNNRIRNSDHFKIYESEKSLIENKVRNNDY